MQAPPGILSFFCFFVRVWQCFALLELSVFVAYNAFGSR